MRGSAHNQTQRCIEQEINESEPNLPITGTQDRQWFADLEEQSNEEIIEGDNDGQGSGVEVGELNTSV